MIARKFSLTDRSSAAARASVGAGLATSIEGLGAHECIGSPTCMPDGMAIRAIDARRKVPLTTAYQGPSRYVRSMAHSGRNAAKCLV